MGTVARWTPEMGAASSELRAESMVGSPNQNEEYLGSALALSQDLPFLVAYMIFHGCCPGHGQVGWFVLEFCQATDRCHG